MRRRSVILFWMVISLAFGCGGGSSGKKMRTDNRAPTLAPIPTPLTASPGSPLAFQVTATDPDFDSLTLTAAPLPPNATLIDNGNGTADFSFTADVTQLGQIYSIMFSASDGISPPVTQLVDIDVASSGTGDFVEVTPVTLGNSAWGMDAADLDGDGYVDIVASDYGSAAGTGFFVLIGDGAGGFTATAESPYVLTGASTSPSVRHVKVGDLDNDGAQDVVAVSRNDGDVHVFLGDAPGGTPDGTFTEHLPGFIDMASGDFHYPEIADMDGDGDQDIIVTAMSGGSLRVYLGDGTGTFVLSAQSPYDISAGTGGIGHVAIGDLTGDGIPDMATCDFIDDVISVLIGDNDGSGRNGNATFVLGSVSNPTPLVSPGLPVLADFDRDTNLDIAAPHFSSPAEFTVWLGNGAGGFTEALPRPAMGSMAEYAATGDFNGDGNPDLVGTCSSSADLWVFFGDGAGGFTGAAANPRPLSASVRYVLAADFNNDGVSDLAAAAEGVGTIHIFIGL